MVNAAAQPAVDAPDRRTRAREAVVRASELGAAKLNPFGDLHTLQHLSARLARALRQLFEPLLREEVRCWAEPLEVQRFADYRAERPDRLTAWLPMAMAPGDAHALLVLDGRFVLELLDLFFGGTGHVPHDLPGEFTPAAEAMVERLGTMVAGPLEAAWEPLSRIGFAPGRVEANASMLGGIDADDAVIATRFGVAHGAAKPVFVDIVYPVAAMKPHGAQLTGKVVAKPIEPDDAWRATMARAAMEVTFPVRSVLAEPVVSLARLMQLQPGDVIPIHFTDDVPVMVGGDRLGTGTVGAANGRAAIRLTRLTRLPEGQTP